MGANIGLNTSTTYHRQFPLQSPLSLYVGLKKTLLLYLQDIQVMPTGFTYLHYLLNSFIFF